MDNNDWNMWLNSSETIIAIEVLEDTLKEVESMVVDGYLLQQTTADKIAVDYAHKVGIVEGIRKAIQSIKDISTIVEESNGNRE